MRLQDLPAALLDLSATHCRRQRAVIDSPQGVEVVVDGRSYVSFASNDYLGLADHPALVRAAQQGLERWGVGGGSSHLLAGHFSVQQQAEERWRNSSASLRHYCLAPAMRPIWRLSAVCWTAATRCSPTG
ncbi:hypothetical protein JOS77_15050 [Chromobacterium haemolyticum]|nr:hypothetical protein JOS77_15050 [Chromobacterium haemolyticum]